MKQIPVSLSELYNRRLPLGRVGENVHVQIVFQCNAIFADYPNATTKLIVTAPGGDSYAPEIEKSGTNILWTITDSDLAEEGGGEVQLTFTNGNEKIKSYIGKTQIFRSLAENGKVPTPIENWIEKAEETVQQMAQDAADATVEELADTKDACIEEIEQAGEDTRATIPADYTSLSDDVTDLRSAIIDMTTEEILLRSELPGTTIATTFDSDENPVSIVHSKNGTIVRTDTFVWETNTVTETRTASDKRIIITTNLTTLAQTVSEIQEVA